MVARSLKKGSGQAVGYLLMRYIAIQLNIAKYRKDNTMLLTS